MQLKVILPSGEVNVPVEPNSTPGHLKENLKYSLRVPPKMIRLTCGGRELEDIKPLAGEPNNVKDGAVIVAEAKEGVPEEDDSVKAEVKSADKPIMIKKEEPPKPKKIKKDAVRPTLADGDVVKKNVVRHGSLAWTQEFLEGKQPKRHLAFMRLEVGSASAAKVTLAAQAKVRIVGLKAKPELNGTSGVLIQFDEAKGRWQTRLETGKVLEVKPDNLEAISASGNKTYPEDDGVIAIALGDPQTSPAWTAAATQMEIGEKAEFTISKKVVDFDPEGLNPTDSGPTWTIELVDVVTVFDVNGDFMQLLHVESPGGAERANDLDNVAVHWRVRRWMAEGFSCVASSRERIAIMPGYGLVPIEDQNAPPVNIPVGEGQQEAVELVAMKVGAGGKGHVYLKSEALKDNRPAGCVVIDVEVVAMDPNRGPGTPGWGGWQCIVAERSRGDTWLDNADERRKQLETFGTLQKSTESSKDAEAHVAKEVVKFSNNAIRRYRRTLSWLEKETQDEKKVILEKATVQMRLAKSTALAHQRFGTAAEGDATEEEKQALAEAQELLKEALATGEAQKKESLVSQCLKMVLQMHIQAEDVAKAREVLEKLLEMKPGDDELKSDSARINRLEAALALKQGASNIEKVQSELQAANTAQDKAKVAECLQTVLGMITGAQVTWDTVRTCKIGKDVGNAMKMGDPDLAAQARKVVQEIQALAQRAGIGL
eukprot:TRINITY_DN23762_c0_g1_i1.p1 TRINITY_DN23762_c0_g1~~TRINITY_DN23762_c0_g1_i1.p1  ORF type:complete len:712 (-),score=148.44 TRINITY_DN23762_c0_g1_i1:180-2315(-)